MRLLRTAYEARDVPVNGIPKPSFFTLVSMVCNAAFQDTPTGSGVTRPLTASATIFATIAQQSYRRIISDVTPKQRTVGSR